MACSSAPRAVSTSGWSELRTQNFVFYTDLSRSRAEGLAVDLERFRAAISHFTNARRFDSPIPVRIFVFSRASSFRPFAPRRNVAGFVQPSVRSYDVAFSGNSSDDFRRILYHEYVHFILRNQSGVLYPKWYDEGFAEFLSTTRVSGERLIVGEIDRNAASWIHGSRPPVETLLDTEAFTTLSPNETAQFYAWSWLLVHFLVMDHDYAEGDSFGASMLRYVKEVARGRPEPEAFETAWGLSARELARRLEALTHAVGRGAIPLEVLDFDDSVETIPMSEELAALRLGELALHVNKPTLARAHYERALLGRPDEARALAGLADTYKAVGDWEGASASMERALALAPDDPLTVLDHGELWLHRAIVAGYTPDRDAWLRRARADFRRVLELDPGNPEAMAVLGVSQLADGNFERAILQLERASRTLPNDWMVQTELMRAYASAGRQGESARIARRLLVAVHDPDQAREIRAFLRGLSAR